jgi:imidazolonepropionase-like amidohydrolase
MASRFFLMIGISILALGFMTSAQGQVAVKGELIHTMAGAPITDGVVLIDDGKITQVGKASEIVIPTDFKVMSAKVVTPGLIDAHSVVGLAGYYNQQHDQDQLEKSDPIQPELRAIDAYNAREPLVAWLRSLGVTTLHTGHAPGALISGQTIIVKTKGETVEQAIVNPLAMIAATLGEVVERNFKSPGTRAKGMAMLRAELIKAQLYNKKQQAKEKDKRPDRDLKMEMLTKAINNEIPLLITVQKYTEIMSALRLAKEFEIRIVLDGAAEAYLVLDEIKTAGVSVILHPSMVRTAGETQNASLETAAQLKSAGIPFALQSGYESYVPKTRVVLFEAAIAAANGLSFSDALAAITIESARILGIAQRVGSLENGKDADVVLFDGDPFEYTTHVCGVIIDGEVVKEECL